MSTVLKNIIQFTGLVVGVPTALPHGLNVNGIPVAPQLGGVNVPGFTITANAAAIIATRTATATSGNVNVYVEHWHTIEEALPLPGELAGLTPFFLSGGGGGVTFPDITDTPGEQVLIAPAGFGVQGVNSLGYAVRVNPPGGGEFGVLTDPTGFAQVFISQAGLTIEGFGLLGQQRVSPVPFTGTHNNEILNIGPYGYAGDLWLFSTSGASVLTGIDASYPTGTMNPYGAPRRILVNDGTGTLTLTHDDPLSIATNRFRLPGAASVIIPAGGTVTVQHMTGFIAPVGPRWWLVAKGF